MTLRPPRRENTRGIGLMQGHAALVGFLLAYLFLGIVYSVSSPILEAPDEMWHYSYVRHLTTEHALPQWDAESPAAQESSQPPLYYTVAALATDWIDASRLEDLPDRNPHWGYPAAGTVNDNKNMFFHRRLGVAAFPWQGATLVVHLARLANLSFGALTVGATYLLAKEVFPKRPIAAAAATGIVAFNPQFLFVSSAVNNDATVSAFCTAALWLLMRGLRHGYTTQRVAALGGVAGLATLSKVSALALLPFAIVCIGVRTWLMSASVNQASTDEVGNQQGHRSTKFLVHCSLFLVLVLVISGWWYIRNAVLYGDALGVETHLETWWAHEEPVSLATIWTQLANVEVSFWGAFGWGNVHLPPAFYIVLRVAVRLALAGLLMWGGQAWRARRQPSSRAWSLALLFLWVLMVFVALLSWMQLVEAALGRLLFPAIGGIAVLMTWGLDRLTSYAVSMSKRASPVAQHAPQVILVLLVGSLLCAAAASPFATIRPAYAKPPLLSAAEVESLTQPISIQFGDGIRLIGYDVQVERAMPGEEISVTLCWEASEAMRENYAYFVHLVGQNDRVIGARDTHPGLGRFPTSHWAPGDIFCDVVRVPVGEPASGPAVYTIETGWYRPETGARLSARAASGAATESVALGRVKVAAGDEATFNVPNPVEASLGDQILLLGYRVDTEDSEISPGQTVDVTLYWKAQSRPRADYTVFVHLGAPFAPPTAQDDGQPRGGTYPTSFWDAGEVVIDTHTIRLPDSLAAGDYPLVAGMYLFETGGRLPAFDARGKRFPGDAIPLTTLRVGP